MDQDLKSLLAALWELFIPVTIYNNRKLKLFLLKLMLKLFLRILKFDFIINYLVLQECQIFNLLIMRFSLWQGLQRVLMFRELKILITHRVLSNDIAREVASNEDRSGPCSITYHSNIHLWWSCSISILHYWMRSIYSFHFCWLQPALSSDFTSSSHYFWLLWPRTLRRIDYIAIRGHK